jgi:hypothetical protein
VGKFSELSASFKTIELALEDIQMAVGDIKEALGGGEATEQPPAPKPITLEQVRAVLADKSRAGHTAAVRELLQKYGADKLSAIDPANYTALLADATRVGLTEVLA